MMLFIISHQYLVVYIFFLMREEHAPSEVRVLYKTSEGWGMCGVCCVVCGVCCVVCGVWCVVCGVC